MYKKFIFLFCIVSSYQCFSNAIYFTITCNFSASTIVTNVSCNGGNDGSIDLTLSGSSGYSYQWSTGDTTEDINGLNAGIYSVIITDTFACTLSISITVEQPAMMLSHNTLTLCFGQSYSIGSHTYSSSGIYIDTLISAYGCDSIVATILTVHNNTRNSNSVTECDFYTWMVNNQTYTQSGIYTDTSINANGCLHTDTLYLTINNSSSSFVSLTECDSYTWIINNQTYVNSGFYTEILTDVFGCDSVINLDLKINSSPKATFSFEQFNMCELVVRFTNTSENFNTSLWRFGDNEYSNYRNPSHTYNKASEYLVSLIVRNNFDCIDSIKTNINLNKSTIFIPNSFTPNNDGLNDRFIIYSDIIQNYELWIYNRWNERVFYSNDVQKNWGGLYKEKECNEGTYTWKLKYACGEAIKIRTGIVKLVR